MSYLIADLLSESEQAAIEAVLASKSVRFDVLVKTSGLDPASDFKFSDLRCLNFCGADLRGFDFTGSDLRGTARNAETLVDSTTILDDAKVDWVELEALPIVVKMQEIERVATSQERMELIDQLITQFGKTEHVVKFLVAAASSSRNLDQFLDFAQFIPSQLSVAQLTSLRDSGSKLLRLKLAKSRSRTRRKTTALLAVEGIVNRLRGSPGSLAESIFDRLAEATINRAQSAPLRSVEVMDLENAFATLGHKEV